MSEKTVFVGMARGIVLAGILLAIGGGRGAVLGGGPSAVKDVTLRGLDNERIKLVAPSDGATVLIFYSSECPISNAYSPTLQELMAKYRQKPVEWVGICVDPDLSDSDVKSHARDFKLGFRIAHNKLGSFAGRSAQP